MELICPLEILDGIYYFFTNKRNYQCLMTDSDNNYVNYIFMVRECQQYAL